MTPDILTSQMPILLETNPELFTQQDLQDIYEVLASIETQSQDEVAERLAAFYRTHRHIRDALRNWEGDRAELKKVKPSQANQSTRITNFFQELSQQVKDKLKSESSNSDSGKSSD
jgi:hypothetical protein